MFGRKLVKIVKDQTPEVTPTPEVVAAPTQEHAADISSIINFTKSNDVTDAYSGKYTDQPKPFFYCSFSLASYLTLEFEDKAISIETHHTVGYRDMDFRSYSKLHVYRKDASPQLDLFKEVETSSLVGTIGFCDVSPAQFAELFRFVSEKVKAASELRKQEGIAAVLSNFE